MNMSSRNASEDLRVADYRTCAIGQRMYFFRQQFFEFTNRAFSEYANVAVAYFKLRPNEASSIRSRPSGEGIWQVWHMKDLKESLPDLVRETRLPDEHCYLLELAAINFPEGRHHSETIIATSLNRLVQSSGRSGPDWQAETLAVASERQNCGDCQSLLQDTRAVKEGRSHHLVPYRDVTERKLSSMAVAAGLETVRNYGFDNYTKCHRHDEVPPKSGAADDQSPRRRLLKESRLDPTETPSNKFPDLTYPDDDPDLSIDL